MFKCKVLEKDEAIAQDTLTIGLPDENGTIVQLTTTDDADLDGLVKGGLYTLAFVPFVAADHPHADKAASDAAATDSMPVPVDHPTVIAPVSAGKAETADADDVPVAPVETAEAAPVAAVEEAPVVAADPTAAASPTPVQTGDDAGEAQVPPASGQ